MSKDVEKVPMIEAGLEIGLTIQPVSFDSIRVSASLRKEAPADVGVDALFDEIRAELEQQIAKSFLETKEGYKIIKQGI